MRRIIMLVVVALVMAAMMVAMAMPAFADAECAASSSGSAGFGGTTNNGQGKQARADEFFGGSTQELQQAHCNPKQVG
jgi:hypothetical protein